MPLFFLKPPNNIKIKKIQRDVEEIEDAYKSSKHTLPEKKLIELTNIVKRQYDSWDEGFGPMRTNLKELNKLMEGNLDKTDFPFGEEASSQIDLRLAAEKFRSLSSNYRRTVFAGKQLTVAKLNPGSKINGALRNKIEAAENWTISELSNLEDTLKDTDLPCFRDGTALIYGEYLREAETGVDCEVYSNLNAFQADYPDAETAGVSEKKYDEIVSLLNEPEEEGIEPLEVRVEYEIDFVSKNGPKYTLLPLYNFIFYPFFPDKIKDLSMYGYEYKEQRAKFLEKKKHGYYIKEAIEDMVFKPGDTTYEDEWDQARDEVEGIQGDYKEAYKFARIIIKADLNDDKRPEYYKVIYWPENRKIIRVEKYNVRRNIPCIVPFKFLGRDGRLLGISLLNDGKDLFGEINALHRDRSNKRRLTSQITMIAPDSMKDTLGDLYEFDPGSTLWTPDALFEAGQVPRQFVLQNLDNSDYKDEEYSIRFLEGLIGPSAGMSGQESMSDPSAPGNKTAMLLQRSDYRVIDLIDEWKRSIDDIVSLNNALLHQNYKSKIQFINQDGEDDDIDTSLLISEMIKFRLKAITVPLSPEVEMSRIANVAKSAVLFAELPFQADPDILRILWNDYINAARLSNGDAYLVKKPIVQKQNPEAENPDRELQNNMEG